MVGNVSGVEKTKAFLQPCMDTYIGHVKGKTIYFIFPSYNNSLTIPFSLYCPAVNKILIGGQEYWHNLC